MLKRPFLRNNIQQLVLVNLEDCRIIFFSFSVKIFHLAWKSCPAFQVKSFESKETVLYFHALVMGAESAKQWQGKVMWLTIAKQSYRK